MIKVINVINTKSISKVEIEKLIQFYKNYDAKKFEVKIIIPIDEEFSAVLKENAIEYTEIAGIDKEKLDVDTLFELIKIFKKEKPYIVHSYGNKMAEIAAKSVKDCKLIFSDNNEIINENKTKKIGFKFWNEFLPDKVVNTVEVLKDKKENSKQQDEKEQSKDYIKEIQEMYDLLEREPKMKKINLLDVFIILIVLIACIFGYGFIKKSNKAENGDPTTKVIYKVRTTETIDSVYNMIELDTPIYENGKNYYLGKIVDKTCEPSIRYEANLENGEYVKNEIPGYSDIILTIEANADIGTKNIKINDYILKVGSETSIKGKGYYLYGYVISIER